MYIIAAQNMKFFIKISSVNVTKPQEVAVLVTFAEEILNGKLQFLHSDFLLKIYFVFK